MTRSPLPLVGALAITLALLSITGTLTAQAPPPEVEAVYLRVQIGGELIPFQCFEVTTTTQEAPHEKPGPKTPVFASPSPMEAEKPSLDTTPTPEKATPQSPVVTAQPKPTQTPTTHPTAAQTPVSACQGRVIALEGLTVRAQPNGARMGALGYGANVDLYGYVWDTFGSRWYRVQWGSQWAYSHAGWIAPDPACWGLSAD